MGSRELTPWRPPPFWLSLTLTLVLAVAFGLLRVFIYPESIVPIADALPLLLALWHRDKRLLWVLAGMLIGASAYKLMMLMDAARFENVGQFVTFFVMKEGDVIIAATVVHLAVNYRNSVERANISLVQANEELQAANEELAAREEEISRQNEELQVQAEEMQQQSEELQAQGEELRLANEELAARESTLETLLHLSSPAANDDEVLPGVCRSAMELLNGAAACLFKQVDDQFVVRAHAGFCPKGPSPCELPVNVTLARMAVESGGPAHLRDRDLRPDLQSPQPSDGRVMRSVLAAPVRCGGKILGALEVYSVEPRDWTDQQASLLNWLAAQCGQAWETVRLRSAMQALNESLEQKVEMRTAELEARTIELRMLASQLATAEHRERRRIAQVLHDELQQLLVAVRMRLNAASVPDGAWKVQVESLLEQAIDLSRSITTELSPPILFEERFEASLLWLARRMKQQQNLDVEVRCQPGAEPPNDDWRVFLFTAVGECLFNVVKHANVSRASVEVKVDKGQLHTIVTDQGCGFQLNEAQMRARAGESFGLFSVRERAALLGGYVKVQSSPGNGTRVEIVVPLDASQTRLDGPSTVDLVRDSAVAQTPRETTTRASSRSTRGNTGRIRILLADDHQMLREGLAGLLDGHDDLEIVGQAGDGQEAVEMGLALRPDVVVMDVAMPRLNGIEATRALREQAPSVRVIGMSMHARDEMAAAMFDAGAVAYVTKGGPAEQLIDEIRRAAAMDAEAARAAAREVPDDVR